MDGIYEHCFFPHNSTYRPEPTSDLGDARIIVFNLGISIPSAAMKMF